VGTGSDSGWANTATSAASGEGDAAQGAAHQCAEGGLNDWTAGLADGGFADDLETYRTALANIQAHQTPPKDGGAGRRTGHGGGADGQGFAEDMAAYRDALQNAAAPSTLGRQEHVTGHSGYGKSQLAINVKLINIVKNT
jgi:hypothetical protein